MAQFSYRHYLDGNGPYESQKFDTEDQAREFASENRHDIAEIIRFDDQGNPASDSREVIDLDKTQPAAPSAPDQEHTDGTQPA